MFTKAPEFLPDGPAHLADGAVLTVELQAVLEHKRHISQEVLHACVGVDVQSLFYSAEVHGSLYNVEIVRDAQLRGVDRLMENPGLGTFPQTVEQSLGSFVP